jgi:hypothetical protein
MVITNKILEGKKVMREKPALSKTGVKPGTPISLSLVLKMGQEGAKSKGRT